MSLSGAQRFSSWLIEQLRTILEPLQKSLNDEQAFAELFREYGWDPPSNLQEIQNFFPINEFTNLDNLLERVIEADETTDIVDIFTQILSNLKTIIVKVRELSDQRPTLAGTFLFNVNDFWLEFPEALTNGLIIKYLESYHPAVYGLLLLLGIIDENLRVLDGIPGRINYTERTVRWNLLKDALNPLELIKQTYNWGSDEFRFSLLLNRLKQFLNLLEVKAYLAYPPEQLINYYYDPDNPDLPKIRELRIPLIGGTDNPRDPFDSELLLSLIPITPEGNPLAKPNGISLGPSIIGYFSIR